MHDEVSVGVGDGQISDQVGPPHVAVVVFVVAVEVLNEAT